MTAAGLAIGIRLTLGAGRLIASQLYAISPRDPFVMSLRVVTLALVAIVASLVPARRATTVNPSVTPRTE